MKSSMQLTVSTNVFIRLTYSVVFHVTMHQPIVQLHISVYKQHKTHNSLIRSDEGLTFETSVFESCYGGQFTLSTQLIKENSLVMHGHHRRSTTVSLYSYPVIHLYFGKHDFIGILLLRKQFSLCLLRGSLSQLFTQQRIWTQYAKGVCVKDECSHRNFLYAAGKGQRTNNQEYFSSCETEIPLFFSSALKEKDMSLSLGSF